MARPITARQDQQGTSPVLQGGCALIMMANMLIYIGVIVFVFRLLDHSRLDVRYIAARGLTPRDGSAGAPPPAPTPLRMPQTRDILAEITDATRVQASRATDGPLRSADQRPTALQATRFEVPAASLTRSGGFSTGPVRPVRSTIAPSPAFPRTMVFSAQSPFRAPATRRPAMPSYQSIPVLIAPGIRSPVFTIPSPVTVQQSFYVAPSPIGPAVRGAPRIRVPGVPEAAEREPDSNGVPPDPDDESTAILESAPENDASP